MNKLSIFLKVSDIKFKNQYEWRLLIKKNIPVEINQFHLEDFQNFEPLSENNKNLQIAEIECTYKKTDTKNKNLLTIFLHDYSEPIIKMKFLESRQFIFINGLFDKHVQSRKNTNEFNYIQRIEKETILDRGLALYLLDKLDQEPLAKYLELINQNKSNQEIVWKGKLFAIFFKLISSKCHPIENLFKFPYILALLSYSNTNNFYEVRIEIEKLLKIVKKNFKYLKEFLNMNPTLSYLVLKGLAFTLAYHFRIHLDCVVAFCKELEMKKKNLITLLKYYSCFFKKEILSEHMDDFLKKHWIFDSRIKFYCNPRTNNPNIKILETLSKNKHFFVRNDIIIYKQKKPKVKENFWDYFNESHDYYIIKSEEANSLYKLNEESHMQKFIMKVFSLPGDIEGFTQQEEEYAQRLVSLRHKNLVRIYESFLDEGGRKLCFIMEKIVGYTIENHLSNKQYISFDDDTIINWFIQICSGIFYLNSCKLFNFNLRPSKIFIQDNVPKVLFLVETILKTDESKYIYFPFSNLCKRTINKINEGFTHLIHESKNMICINDIWSIGYIFYLICINSYPYKNCSKELILTRIFNHKKMIQITNRPENLQKIVMSMLEIKEEEKKTNFIKIFETPFLKELIESRMILYLKEPKCIHNDSIKYKVPGNDLKEQIKCVACRSWIIPQNGYYSCDCRGENYCLEEQRLIEKILPEYVERYQIFFYNQYFYNVGGYYLMESNEPNLKIIAFQIHSLIPKIFYWNQNYGFSSGILEMNYKTYNEKEIGIIDEILMLLNSTEFFINKFFINCKGREEYKKYFKIFEELMNVFKFLKIEMNCRRYNILGNDFSKNIINSELNGNIFSFEKSEFFNIPKLLFYFIFLLIQAFLKNLDNAKDDIEYVKNSINDFIEYNKTCDIFKLEDFINLIKFNCIFTKDEKLNQEIDSLFQRKKHRVCYKAVFDEHNDMQFKRIEKNSLQLSNKSKKKKSLLDIKSVQIKSSKNIHQ